MANTYTSPEIQLDSIDPDFQRVDIEFHGVDHAGPSFEARVFINNPEADENTPATPDSGYAGSFHVFGHGGCFGDVGHCDVRSRRAYDPRPLHPLAQVRKTVRANKEVIRRALQEGKPATVTIVPVVSSLTEKCDSEDDVVSPNKVSIVTYR